MTCGLDATNRTQSSFKAKSTSNIGCGRGFQRRNSAARRHEQIAPRKVSLRLSKTSVLTVRRKLNACTRTKPLNCASEQVEAGRGHLNLTLHPGPDSTTIQADRGFRTLPTYERGGWADERQEIPHSAGTTAD